MRFQLFEHRKILLCELSDDQDEADVFNFERLKGIIPRNFHDKDLPCFKVHHSNSKIELEADYYVGLDWLVEGAEYIQVLPKINTFVISSFEKEFDKEEGSDNISNVDQSALDNAEVLGLDYIKMFMDAIDHPIVADYAANLMCVDWNSKAIEIDQKDDILTPFLIIRYLSLLKQIVKKGLKKSYYTVSANLNGQVKGKIIVGKQVKFNLLKNKFTNTYCEYQQFGVDSTENQFLKKVLKFVQNYVVINDVAFRNSKVTLDQMISYSLPSFEFVSDIIDEHKLRQIKFNPFFKEYREAIKIGQFILKRFGFNIRNVSNQKILTPPFWLDMPTLFELYTYRHLLTVFNHQDVHYHFKTNGNELDFLITTPGKHMVIDAKYKVYYDSKHVHNDIRQVSGYARLKKVYRELDLEGSKELIDCVIIYPLAEAISRDFQLKIELNDINAITAYERVYKIGLPLPLA
jgi:5-methylcytosine-specific restriction enzyme subunit McrC